MLRLVQILLAFAATVIIVVIFVAFPGGSARYELVVNLELDGVPYTGSTIWEVHVSATPGLLPGRVNYRVRGEAIDIPLPDGRTLFVLRRSRSDLSSYAYGREYLRCVPGNNTRETVAALRSFNSPCDLGIEPMILIADREGKIENVPYGPDEANPRVRLLSAIGTAHWGPLRFLIVRRHPWISGLPSSEPIAHANRLYIEDFSRL